MIEKKFYVTFNNHTEIYNKEQFNNFIKIAVMHNKDITHFNVEYKL